MIKLGMIGCGRMARSHLAALEPLKQRMRFASFADLDEERARNVAGVAQDATYYCDYRDLLNDVDAVVIALPHDLHYEVGMTCLNAGKHVLIEKPLAITEEQCAKMIQIDTSPDPVLMVGYIMRHNPLWNYMGKLIRNQTYGKPFHVSIWTEQYTDLSRGEWLGRADRVGGGQLFSHGCHYIDLLLHWLGEPVCGAHFGTNLGTPWMEKEGSSNVSLRFESGATAYHFGTWGARGSKLGYAVHAHCTGGMLELNHAEGTITLHRDQSGGDLPAMESLAIEGETPEAPNRTVIYRSKPNDGKAVVQQFQSFLDCIENKKKPDISAAASIPSLRVIWRLYEAEQNGLIADLRSI